MQKRRWSTRRKVLFASMVVVVGMLPLAGRSLPLRTFVDPKGAPIEGVLVVSDRGPYILQSDRVSVALSTSDGVAPVSYPGCFWATKPGYLPWSTEWMLADEARSLARRNGRKVVLYQPTSDPQSSVSMSRVTIVIDDGPAKAIDLPKEIDVQVECTGVGSLRAWTNAHQLLESDRFYFEGASSETWSQNIAAEDDLYFYVRGRDHRIYKVGVSRGNLASMPIDVEGRQTMVSASDFAVMWTRVIDEHQMVVPSSRRLAAPRVTDDTELIAFPDLASVTRAFEVAVNSDDVEGPESLSKLLKSALELARR